ncbi:hypothetical protein, conserved [Eimeria necatrix]|uniref:ABC transporter domain-containing protein n=1 Tax=Eimeria necatrix TaxID=51315 RepID=U6MNF2_9EIME|nr:hypothetical protein, conserved [Eimeria necatrix]CDJ63190.1 hypothetical protein, conserved [Eimeria necatrix]
MDLPSIRRSVSYVEQEPLLFRRSIADNIAYGLRPLQQSSDDWMRCSSSSRLQQQQKRGKSDPETQATKQQQQECQQQQQEGQQQQREGQQQQQQECQQRQQQETDLYEAELSRTLRHPEAAAWPAGLLQQVVAAAAAANALPFIKQLADGVFTVCGEGGVRLSGGQKQRIAVARALLRKPRLLILDEASSCLDADSEAALASTLRRLKGQTTVITIAHKPSSLKEADRVVVIEDGQVAAEGPRSEMLGNKSSRHRQLLQDEL